MASFLGIQIKIGVIWSKKSNDDNCKIQKLSCTIFSVLPQCVGKNVLNFHGQISMGENHLPSQAYTSIFKVYGNGSC